MEPNVNLTHVIYAKELTSKSAFVKIIVFNGKDYSHYCAFLYFTEKAATYFFTQKLTKQVKVRRKKDCILECMLNDPTPSVKWFKNGAPIEVRILAVAIITTRK